MDTKWRGRIIRYTPLVLWAAFVLALSTSGASMSRTSQVILPILRFIFPDASPADLTFYHGIVRKFAHFFEYGVLALLALRAFVGSSKQLLTSYPFVAAIAVAAFLSTIDETNQSFVPGRTGAALDVVIDLSGAATVLLVAYWLSGRVKN